jgi:plasmid replication initiation protein
LENEQEVGGTSSRELEQLLLPGMDSPLTGAVKGDRVTMLFSFFALTNAKLGSLPPYDDGRVKIKVRAPEEIGVATVWDKDVLVYIVSLMVERMNKGQEVSKTVHFTIHDFCRVTGIKAAGTAYERLKGALERLQGTQVITNIETGGEGQDDAFSWLPEARMQYRRNSRGEKILKSVRVTVCDWIWRAITVDQRILTYDPAWFHLPPLEKRLYEVARSYCGRKPGFIIGLEKLQQRVGSETDLKKFKLALTKIATKRRPLPGYTFSIINPAGPGKKTSLKAIKVRFWNITDHSLIQAAAASASLPMIDNLPILEDLDDDLNSAQFEKHSPG